MNVQYPEIQVRLSGTDGNAFAILGKVQKAMKEADVPAAKVKEFMDEATEGDYDHLLQTAMKWVSVS